MLTSLQPTFVEETKMNVLKTQGIFKIMQNDLLGVGAFNPVEKDCSKWESSPDRDEHKTYFETTT